ncbi:MAG: BTAD domain-containing putative transcriptional regulator [Gemmatimonadales bacterium]
MLRLKTFGGLALTRDGTPVEGAGAQRRRLALLALLAAAGERGLAREKVLALLWPESDPERARKSLAQAVYALRRELGSEELIVGVTELRLGWEGFTSDLAEFRAALQSGQHDKAAGLYEGPFLDGVYIDEAPEFERWAESERGSLAHDYVVLLEQLAREAEHRGEYRAAVGWWRKLANADPLNSKVALGLMLALRAAGDRGGALQHFRVYEMLLKDELDLAPDRALLDLADSLKRASESPLVEPSRPAANGGSSAAGSGILPTVGMTTVPGTPAAVRPLSTPAPSVPSPRTAGHERVGISGKTDEYARPRPMGDMEGAHPFARPAPAAAEPVKKPFLARKSTRYGIILGFGLGVLVAAFASIRVRLIPERNTGPEVPVVAVGLIRDFTKAREGLTLPLADMLATNLARAEGIQVISTARMYELLSQQESASDSLGAIMRAARAAGATDLLDGALIDSAGSYQLDLRRTRIASGSLGGAFRVSGKDLFALVEAGTTRLVGSLGVKGPSTSFADVTTASLVAYRFYEEGLRAFFAGQGEATDRLLSQALAEDSTFAMAAYWLAKLRNGDVPLMERALRLSERASDRERLLIRAGWADMTDDPSRLATAESLTTRYPAELEGYLWLGHAQKWVGDFPAAVASLKRVIRMDSASLAIDMRGTGAPMRCLACEATVEISSVYHMMDSLPAAEREIKGWIRKQPRSISAWGNLEQLYVFWNHFDEAAAASRTLSTISPGINQEWFLTHVAWRAGRYREADSLFAILGESQVTAGEGLKWLSISLRTQGRVREALAPAERLRATMKAPRRDAVPYTGLFEAQVYFDQGNFRRAAAIFDSISRAPLYSGIPSQIARNLVWTQTLRATALAAAGDTAILAGLADSVEAWGRGSSYGRDRRLYHHIRGLLLTARGDLEDAVREYRQAIFSTTTGYTRTNLELGRVLLRLGRPREAAELAEAALRGAFESTGTYATQTELAELAAAGWDGAGKKDSALVRYRQVASNWAHADAVFGPRVERARLRIAALSGQ